MSNQGQNKSEKKITMKTRSSSLNLNDDLRDDIPAATGRDDLGSLPSSGGELADILKAATSNFETIVEKAMQSLIESVRNVERALEFEGSRISDMERKNAELEDRLVKMEKSYELLAKRVQSQDSETIKAERLSRRNNFRIVGVAEPKEGETEDCSKLVRGILEDKFKMTTDVVRARREGKPGDKPRHIVVTSSYQDKISILKNGRESLKDETFYVVNDLTKHDLEEKRKYKKEVQELYSKGIKLRFYSGKWRGDGGAVYFKV